MPFVTVNTCDLPYILILHYENIKALQGNYVYTHIIKSTLNRVISMDWTS